MFYRIHIFKRNEDDLFGALLNLNKIELIYFYNKGAYNLPDPNMTSNFDHI